MLYEPSKTKRYILIWTGAVILAVLAIVLIPLLYGNKTIQTPATNLSPQAKLQQEKIQKEFDKLDQIRKSQNTASPTKEEVQKEFDRIKSLGAIVIKEPYDMGGMWIATLADPDGNYFQLMSPWKGEK